jgi:SAM-dependent methyltransferase
MRTDASSFRDPAGFVFTRDGVVYRQVNSGHRDLYDQLIGSGLYDALVDDGLLVPHSEVDPGLAAAPDAYKVLRPEQLPFVSYPYEWSFGQLRDAALATLTIQQRALDHGMTLRDASAYNMQFWQGRPILIDTLSFGPREPDAPWLAYRQFCQHFLAPVALMSMVDVRLGQLQRVHLDGLPLDLTSELLPGRSRARPALQLHVHAHAKSQRRHERDGGGQSAKQVKMSDRALTGLLDNLAGGIRKLDWDPPASEWRDYYDGDSYRSEAFAHKEELVAEFVAATRPATVWDLGANTGHFARLAAREGAFVVAFDIDPSAVEINYRQARADGETTVLPLVLDLTNPSPALGWEHRERRSLIERGPVDLVLALALVHHLAIANNVPLRRIVEHFADMTDRVVVEFVPKTDPKVQTLLASREDIFPDYTEEGFEAALDGRFTVERRERVRDSDRTLYLLRAA